MLAASEHGWQVFSLRVALVLVTGSLLTHVNMWVDNGVHLLAMIVDQILRGAQVTLLESLICWSVSQEQVGPNTLGVSWVECLLQFFLLFFLENGFLSARLDLISENRRIKRKPCLVLRNASPSFFL